ncbi:MAG: hypothetical protein ACWGNV_03785 [Bacteroidales bacterium]
MAGTKKLGLLLIRGSGHSDFKRQDLFMDRLKQKLTRNGTDPEQVAHEVVDWYGPLQEQQEIVMQRMKEAGIRLKSKLTRQLIITNIGDLINYGGKPGFPHFGYDETHKKVHKTVLSLKNKLPEGAPLLIIATSMGTEIINDYIMDRQKAVREQLDDPMGNSPFERFETLTGLFTLGNNLPIFAASYHIDEIRPIEFPSVRLPPGLREVAVWENYFDKNDSMGYPLKPLNDHFKNLAVLKDIRINTGGPFSFWNFLSHFGYWRSRKLVKRLASYIDAVLTKV